MLRHVQGPLVIVPVPEMEMMQNDIQNLKVKGQGHQN